MYIHIAVYDNHKKEEIGHIGGDGASYTNDSAVVIFNKGEIDEDGYFAKQIERIFRYGSLNYVDDKISFYFGDKEYAYMSVDRLNCDISGTPHNPDIAILSLVFSEEIKNND